MPDKINDGGPAFPTDCDFLIDGEVVTHSVHGMSLRDWFAGMAMQALITSPIYAKRTHANWGARDWMSQIADEAFKMAEAILAKRAKGKPHA